MDKNQITKYLEEHNIQKIRFAFADIDGVLRGKTISKEKFLDGLAEGYGFCDVVFGWDNNDSLYDGVSVTGWHTGFPDKPCSIDLSTFRTIPWEDNIPFFIADFSKAEGQISAVCPRTLLKQIVSQCESMGFHAKFAQEFEWFNFLENPHSVAEKDFAGMKALTPGMFGYSILRTSQQSGFYYDLFNLLGQYDIPLEGLHTETGPGVYEAAIRYDYVLKAADKAVLFKNAVKEIASRHGIMATFMAKWNQELPGCSGHVHQSLWSEDRSQNLFYDGGNVNKISDLLRHYIAGQLYCLPHIMPMYAPTVNSYKRLVEGAWAPTTVSWAFDNRTTALRVLNTSEKYTRLETRIPGADTNPYLAMAASLASGLYGIKNQLILDYEPVKGNAYTQPDIVKLPSNLKEASTIMQGSAVAKELFGETFVEHFAKTRLWEWKLFSEHVSNWELRRYFEII